MAAVALALASFAHTAIAQPSSGPTYGVPVEVAANPDLYRLPDGSLPVFCLAMDDQGTQTGGECEFCRLADGAGLLAHGELAKHFLTAQLHGAQLQQKHIWQTAHAGQARAPPSHI